MNEQAEQVLADMMQRALDGVDAAVDFSQAQIPEVVEQLLLWHMVRSAIGCLIAVACLICAYFMATRCWAVVKTETRKNILKQSDGVIVGMPIIGGMGTLIMMVGFFASLSLDWLQILIAPKLYLLEYAADLVK